MPVQIIFQNRLSYKHIHPINMIIHETTGMFVAGKITSFSAYILFYSNQIHILERIISIWNNFLCSKFVIKNNNPFPSSQS